MKLSDSMAKSPQKSYLDVFRALTANLLTVQTQLDKNYHEYDLHRDRIFTVIYLRRIRTSFRKPIPDTARQDLNKITSHLSEGPKTAGANLSNMNTFRTANQYLCVETCEAK